MRNRVPVPASERPPIPEFTPVPRKYRHDGWTPERQKAFIEALADRGSVRRRPMASATIGTIRRSRAAPRPGWREKSGDVA